MVEVIKLLIATPLMWMLYLIGVGVILIRRARFQDQRLKQGWSAAVVGVMLLLLFSLAPIADLITQPLMLSYRVAEQDVFQDIETVVVLGGGARAGRANSVTYSRTVEGIRVFNKVNAQWLIFQGAENVEGEPSNAEVMKAIALERGVPEEKIITESRSRVTAEHPRELLAVLPAQITKLGIVTSALHMPRTMLIFKGELADKQLVPIPVDVPMGWPRYEVAHFVPSVEALLQSTAALHEWIGMAWYSILSYAR